MTTAQLEKRVRALEQEVKTLKAANKAHVVRYAIQRLAEEEAILNVMEAERELADGKGLRGDLDKLLKKIK